MEKIISIVKTEFTKEVDFEDKKFDGFQIRTDKQTISIGIESESKCCEDSGYLLSEDNISDFVGSDMVQIEKVDSGYNKTVFDKITNVKNRNSKAIKSSDKTLTTVFINVVTSSGVLQFVAYNCQNGYYGHKVYIESEQFNFDSDI